MNNANSERLSRWFVNIMVSIIYYLQRERIDTSDIIRALEQTLSGRRRPLLPDGSRSHVDHDDEITQIQPDSSFAPRRWPPTDIGSLFATDMNDPSTQSLFHEFTTLVDNRNSFMDINPQQPMMHATLAQARSTKPELISKDNCLWLEKEKLMDFTPAGLRVVPSKLAACPLENDVSPGLWEMKLELERWNDKAQQQEPRQWWSARDLEGCNGIECRHCHATLLVSSEPLQCKDLPSEHWYELVECWICHETKPEEHRARMRPISARSKALLVGSTYFLVHPDDISADTVRLDQDMLNRIDWSKGMATRWVTLLCEKCNKPLGEAQCEQQETKTVMLAIKLFKYSVTLPLSPLERPNFIEFLVHDLVDAAKAHATYRFLIQGKQSNRIYALLWLFNWDTHIIHNHGFKSGDHNGTPEIFRERGRMK
ncbi:hypothetical protein EC973_001535 [Apophysomyces ossiformis]|uniref:Uncharacterized protein n=1 Tax=Apophysomyces ossiformis TaxID=679940 RepID=A0A8H7ENH4_9FUNG|nr:hypothetical protein EC973_001535 [Apophysomyces ossiformis]